jgi:hypothetical protein
MFDRPPTPSTAQDMADRVFVQQWWAQSLFFVLPTEMTKKKGRGGLTCVQGVISLKYLTRTIFLFGSSQFREKMSHKNITIIVLQSNTEYESNITF